MELDRATGVHSAALDEAEAAQDEMMRARVRLGDLIAAEDAAVSGLARAVAQVERTRAGSKARRSAFTQWQMAAVAERAAHARRTVGEDIGAHLFRVLRSAEAALADAELARGKAQAAHLKAVNAADAASARLLELEAIASPRDTSPTGGIIDRCSVVHSGTGVTSSRRTGPAMRRLLTVAVVALLVVGTVPAAQAKSEEEQWRESGRVVRVLDGDTFDMDTDDGTVRVRINGIQAPESDWCGGQEARNALEDLLPKGTHVRLASVKKSSGNAPRGVWRLKRTVHTEVDGKWVDIAPSLLTRGLVFPFPFIGEDAHNDQYMELGLAAHRRKLGVHDPTQCGTSDSADQRVELEVVSEGPGRDTAASEFVMVFNGSDADIDLTGWMVQDTSPLNAYFFPKGSVVHADDYVVVYSNSGKRGIAPDGSRDDRYFYAGTGMRWNNGTTDIALLFDDAGEDDTGNLRDWLVLTPGSA